MEHTAIIRKMTKTPIAEAGDGASGRGSVGIDSAKPRDKQNPALESMLVKRTELRQNMATESTYICKSDMIVFYASLPVRETAGESGILHICTWKSDRYRNLIIISINKSASSNVVFFLVFLKIKKKQTNLF